MTSDEKLDLLMAGMTEVLENQEAFAQAAGGEPPPEVPEDYWIINDVGQKRRNPDYPLFHPEYWSLSDIDLPQIDITDIPQITGSVVDGNYVTKYEYNSYHIMLMPNEDFGVYCRSAGNTVLRLLEEKNGKYVVVDVATLAGKGFVYRAGQIGGSHVMVFQASDRSNCGSVYTNAV